jgi:hypothetical protein
MKIPSKQPEIPSNLPNSEDPNLKIPKENKRKSPEERMNLIRDSFQEYLKSIQNKSQ